MSHSDDRADDLSPSPLADEAAAEILQQLERAVGRLCPRWLADQRDDLVQAAMVRVLEVTKRSEGEREFKASYLWMVAHSALVDTIRRHQRRGELQLAEEGWAVLPGSGKPSPERQAWSREIADGLRRCLPRLVEDRRRAVTLYLLGSTVPEVAELTGWSNKRSENLVFRGLNDLRKCLKANALKP